MQIKIHTRNAKINDAIREHLSHKLLSIAEKSMPVIDANITIDKVKHESIVEINLVGKHINYHGTEQHEDLQTAIDAAVSKIQRQLRRAKEKVQAHSATHLGYIEALPEEKTDKVLDDELIEPELVDIKTMSLDEAAKTMFESGQDFLLFVEPKSKILHIQCKQANDAVSLIHVTEEIVNSEKTAEAVMDTYEIKKAADGTISAQKTKTEKIAVPHMTIDKAVTSYHNNAAKPFFFYVNAYSSRPNILYYKENHKISLIVPNVNLYNQKATAVS